MNEFVENIKEKGGSIKEKVIEEKEKYINENVKKISETKNFLYKGAIGRIKEFKYPSIKKMDTAEKFRNFFKKKIGINYFLITNEIKKDEIKVSSFLMYYILYNRKKFGMKMLIF